MDSVNDKTKKIKMITLLHILSSNQERKNNLIEFQLQKKRIFIDSCYGEEEI